MPAPVEGNRIGQRSGAIIQSPTTSLAEPTGSTEAKMTLWNCPRSGQNGQAFILFILYLEMRSLKR